MPTPRWRKTRALSLHSDQPVLDLRQPVSSAWPTRVVVLPLEGGRSGQGEVQQVLDLAAEAHVETLRHPVHDVVKGQPPAVADLVDELLAQLRLPHVHDTLDVEAEVLRVVTVEGGVLGAQDEQVPVDVLRALKVVHQVLNNGHEAVGVLSEDLGLVQVLHPVDSETEIDRRGSGISR